MTDTLVLFDLDGTLIDSAPDLCAAANRLRTRRGLPALSFEALREYCGSGARGMVWQAMRMAPGTEAFESMRREFLDDYGAHMNDACDVFEGVKDMLEKLTCEGIVWGIVTNKSAVFAKPLCEEKGLLSQASCLVSGSDMGKMKPLPDPILEGVRQSGANFKTVVYVGDDHRDALASQAAGTRFIAAGWGYTKATVDIKDWGADAIARTPAEIAEIVKRLSDL
ncbi:MAG: HAD hydrolase-like protein [Sutterellaceae bacterium]|nr:HAD hydrolase-like protein [Sutterellaceae bacterium]